MPIINKTGIFILCFAAGALAAQALPPAHHIWAYFVGISAFWLLLENARNKKTAFALSWFFGFGLFTAGLHWIGNALLVEGNAYAWAWPLAVTGLPAVLAVFTGLAGLAYQAFFRHKSIALRYGAFIVLLSLSEWLRGHLFTGFPWNLSGTIWAAQPEMLQILWPFDIYGLGLLTLLWAGLPAVLWRARKTLKPATPILFIGLMSAILTYSYGMYRLQSVQLSPIENLHIHIIQPAITQSEKWDAAKMGDNLRAQLDLSTPKNNQGGQHAIIWPETAISQNFLDNAQVQDEIRTMLQSYNGEATLLTGALRYNRQQGQFFNSLISIDQSGTVQNIYDKFHLVPFGEYIPFQQYIPIPTISGFSGFTRGDGPQTQPLAKGISYSPLVCYEILFPGNVTNAAHRPDFIVNATNDAWYGDSDGPHQHLVQAQLRAIEEGMSVVRAANTGISAIIDPLGRIKVKTDLLQSTAITGQLYKNREPAPWSKRWSLIVFLGFHFLFPALVLCPNAQKHKD